MLGAKGILTPMIHGLLRISWYHNYKKILFLKISNIMSGFYKNLNFFFFPEE